LKYVKYYNIFIICFSKDNLMCGLIGLKVQQLCSYSWCCWL